MAHRPVSSTHLRRPTPWNRTRTSRASTERADQLRQSGMAACGHAAARSELGCLPAPSSSLLFGCHRSARAEGAPRAAMHLWNTQTHLSRSRTGVLNPDLESQNTDCGDAGRCSARNVEGLPWIPGGPSVRVIHQITSCKDLREYPDANRGRFRRRDRRNRASRTATPVADWAPGAWLSGYVVGAFSRDLLRYPIANTTANRTMLRRIAAQIRSVKRFLRDFSATSQERMSPGVPSQRMI